MGGVGMGSSSSSGGSSKVVGSPGPVTVAPGGGSSSNTVAAAMARLSITSDESTAGGGQSLGQANKRRERTGSPVGRPADLREFLGNMGLGKYAEILRDNEIDLEAVQLMADSDFQDIGIPEGPRVKLLYALRTKRYPPKSGNINTMKTFLTSLGLARYCKAFEEGEVDMRAIDVMEESDYSNLGVAKGPRLKMMNVLAKAGVGLIATSTSASTTGSVSVSSPETRHSPEFNVTPPCSTIAGGGRPFLRNPISPPRRPSSTVDRSRSVSNSPSSAAAAATCSRSASTGNITSAVEKIGMTVDGDLATDVTTPMASTAHSRDSSLETTTTTTTTTSRLALDESDAFVMEANVEVPGGVRVGGIMFGSGLATPQTAWVSALGRDGEDVRAAVAPAGASAISA